VHSPIGDKADTLEVSGRRACGRASAFADAQPTARAGSSGAELRRVTGSLERAQADLEEAMSIATRGGMRLHEADCHLEYARLHLACGEKEKARQSLAQAKEMIEEMGYHRRDREVAELEEIMNQDFGHGRTRTNTE